LTKEFQKFWANSAWNHQPKDTFALSILCHHTKETDKDVFRINRPVIVPAKTFLSQLV